MLKVADEMTRGFKFKYDGVGCRSQSEPSRRLLGRVSAAFWSLVLRPFINGSSIAGVP